MDNRKTICANCMFCIHAPDSEPKLGNWYHFRCGAVMHDKMIDPVTGEEAYASHEAGFLTKEKHPNCRDMNKGECPLFQRKENDTRTTE